MSGVLIIVYLIGAFVTLLINVGMLTSVTYPWAIFRNVILWPIMLPFLIWAIVRYVMWGDE